MGFLDILYLVASNNGVSLEWMILIPILIGLSIFYANNFQIGSMISFILLGCVFMLFYYMGWDYTSALTLFVMSLIILILSIYANFKYASTGGII